MARDWFAHLARSRVTVVVHTKDDRSFRGILAATYADLVVLKDARLLGSDGSPGIAIDGETLLPRDSISWVQHLTGTAAE